MDGGPSEGKSYVSTYSKEYPVQDDLVMYKLFQQARDNGHVGEIVNLETGECTSTTQFLMMLFLATIRCCSSACKWSCDLLSSLSIEVI